MNYNVNKSVLLSTIIDAYEKSEPARFEVWMGQTLKDDLDQSTRITRYPVLYITVMCGAVINNHSLQVMPGLALVMTMTSHD